MRTLTSAALFLAMMTTVTGCSSSDDDAQSPPPPVPTAANVMANPSYYAPSDLCGVARVLIGDTVGEVKWAETQEGADGDPKRVECTLTDPGDSSTSVRLSVATEMPFNDIAVMFRSTASDPDQCEGEAASPGVTLAAARETTLLCPGSEGTSFIYLGEFADEPGEFISLEVRVPPSVQLDENQLQSWLNTIQNGLNALT